MLIQCPGRIDETGVPEQNLLNKVDQRGLEITRNPRRDWLVVPDRVTTIGDDINLTHVVDLRRVTRPARPAGTDLRMHSLNEHR